MEARQPHLTIQKSFYVEISRVRYRFELVTDSAAELHTQLQAASTAAAPTLSTPRSTKMTPFTRGVVFVTGLDLVRQSLFTLRQGATRNAD